MVNRMNSFHAEWEKYYKEFVADVLYHHNKPISSSIHRQNHTIFGDHSSSNSKSKQKMSDLKQNLQLLGRMYISRVARGGDVEDFMKHENLQHPPALAEGGKLSGGTKAKIMPCLYPDYKPTLIPESPNVNCLVFDGTSLIQHCPPRKSKTFQENSRLCFFPKVLSMLHNIKRLDIIWDRYLPESLKSSTREKQGRGIRIEVLPSTLMPSNFKKFLQVADNKVRLFAFLAGQLAQCHVEGKLIIITIGNTAITSLQIPYPADMITPCNHEEADSRWLLHAAHCLATRHKRIMVTKVVPYVVVLAIFAAAALNLLYKLEKLWVEFMVGKKRCYIPAHELASTVRPEKVRAMPIFHENTGCDTTCEFKGKKKNTAWETWNAFSEVTQAFLSLMDERELSSDNFNIIQHYVCIMYSRTSKYMKVNKARKFMFAKDRPFELIPPTEAALERHIRRAAIQRVHIWRECLISSPDYPDPQQWGWSRLGDEDTWRPHWSSIPHASKACKQLTSCRCNSQRGCTNQCGYKRAAVEFYSSPY